MDLQRLKYFLEVVRQKNFSKAAKNCYVSQPSLSQQIKKLEEEIGGALFLRVRGAIKLSPLGEAFLPHAQAILAEVQVAEEFAERSREDFQRPIRIGAIPTIAPYLIPKILKEIRDRQPSAKFELLENRTEPLIELLITGEIDFVLISPPTQIDDQCDSLSLLNDEFLLALPQAHPLARKRAVSIKDLRQESIILLDNSHCLSRQVASYCEKVGLEPDVSIQGSQIDTLLGIIEMGFGLTFVPESSREFHQQRKILLKPVSPNPCSREIRMAWLPRRILSRSQELVIQTVNELFCKR